MPSRSRWIPWVLVAVVCAACTGSRASTADERVHHALTDTPRAPTFLEPPTGRVLHGMGQWRKGNDAFEAAVDDPRLESGAALIFLHLGDWPGRSWERRSLGLVAAIERQRERGRLLNVTLHLGGLEEGEIVGIDDDIALGSPDAARYEERVRDCARIIAASGLPAFVRIGGEMNGEWEDQHPYLFPRAFRRVVELFDDEGAEHVAFVWCYMPAAAGDFDVFRDGEAKWYPGDDVVDWFGLDVFRREDFIMPDDPRRARASRATRSQRFLAMARERGKPVILNETSAVDVALSPDPDDGAADWDAWFVPFFAFVRAHPEIKAVHYVNIDWKTIGAANARGWLDADVTHSPTVLARFIDELRDPLWLHEPDLDLLHGATEAFGPSRLAPERARLQARVAEEAPRGRAQRGGR